MHNYTVCIMRAKNDRTRTNTCMDSAEHSDVDRHVAWPPVRPINRQPLPFPLPPQQNNVRESVFERECEHTPLLLTSPGLASHPYAGLGCMPGIGAGHAPLARTHTLYVIYIYICICIACVYAYLQYIYIYIEREREGERYT